jgi:carbon storage regulator
MGREPDRPVTIPCQTCQFARIDRRISKKQIRNPTSAHAQNCSQFFFSCLDPALSAWLGFSEGSCVSLDSDALSKQRIPVSKPYDDMICSRPERLAKPQESGHGRNRPTIGIEFAEKYRGLIHPGNVLGGDRWTGIGSFRRQELPLRPRRRNPMLVLSRKVGERVVIGDRIVVTVLEVKGRQVRLGFEAPPDVQIWRGELSFQDHNRSANQGELAGAQ